MVEKCGPAVVRIQTERKASGRRGAGGPGREDHPGGDGSTTGCCEGLVIMFHFFASHY